MYILVHMWILNSFGYLLVLRSHTQYINVKTWLLGADCSFSGLVGHGGRGDFDSLSSLVAGSLGGRLQGQGSLASGLHSFAPAIIVVLSKQFLLLERLLDLPSSLPPKFASIACGSWRASVEQKPIA